MERGDNNLAKDITELVTPDVLGRSEPGTYLIDKSGGYYLCAEIANGRVVRWRVVDEQGDERPVTVTYRREWNVVALEEAAALRKEKEIPKVESPDGGTPTPGGTSGGSGGGGKTCAYVCAATGDGGTKCWKECF